MLAQMVLQFLKSKRKFNDPALSKILYLNKKEIFKDINNSLFLKNGFIKKNYLKALLDKQKNQENSFFDPILWRIWSLSKWYKLQFDKFNNI